MRLLCNRAAPARDWQERVFDQREFDPAEAAR